MKRVAILLLIIFSFCHRAYAEDIKFEASVDKKTVALGESAQLGLTFHGTQNVPAPDIGNIDGCDVKYLGPSTMMTVINGTVSNSITHMYKVQPLRLGKFQLGPFTFKYDGNIYTSGITFLTATDEKPRPEPVKKGGADEDIIESLDIKDRLFLTLKADKSKAYVNEIVPVTIKIYVNRMNVSDIQLPNFNQEGFSKAQFEDPKQYRERMGGLLYDVLEFRTTIFGTRPGEYKLGPATLKCNLAVKKRVRNVSALDDDFLNNRGGANDPYFEDFFTRYERYPVELKSEEIGLELLPLPQDGKPEDFSGAVGDYQFIYSAGPKKVKVGDPVTLKMEINGTGNFNTVIIPKLENTEGFRVYEPQIKTEANRKTFRQVLIPESDKVYQTPKAIFTYFDPDKKIYKTITQEPTPLQVEKVADSPAQVIGQTPAVPPATTLNLNTQPPQKMEDSQPQGDILYIKESIGIVRPKGCEIYKSILFLMIFLVPLVVLITVWLVYAKQDRMRRDTRYAHRTEAFKSMRKEFFELKRLLKSNDAKVFYETLFKALQDYLGGRLYMPVAGLTFDTVEPVLRSKGVDAAVLNKINNIFDVCDRAKFALINADTLLMKDDMKSLEEIIRELEKFKI